MTPAIVELHRYGVPFRVHDFDHDPAERSYGLSAARALGVEPDRVFKTLLTELTAGGGGSGSVKHAVGIVPVTAQLSLKEIATALGAKRAEMCAPAAAERLTGYVVGGISPFGQKKRMATAIDETCELSDTIFVSGGRRGLDLEIAASDLIAVLEAVVAPIAAW